MFSARTKRAGKGLMEAQSDGLQSTLESVVGGFVRFREFIVGFRGFRGLRGLRGFAGFRRFCSSAEPGCLGRAWLFICMFSCRRVSSVHGSIATNNHPPRLQG